MPTYAETLVNVSGSEGEPPHDLTFEGLIFTHTKRTLLDPYLVPSGGDWSVRGSGAVAIRNYEDIAIKGCIFNRTGGHAIVLRGGVLRGSIVGNEMDLLGDSGVVLIGELPGLGNNGSDRVWKGGLPTVPRDTLIESNHFHGLGVWGKQSAALFQALSCRTNFTGNVAYNGPRAAININDGYCGGTTSRRMYYSTGCARRRITAQSTRGIVRRMCSSTTRSIQDGIAWLGT